MAAIRRIVKRQIYSKDYVVIEEALRVDLIDYALDVNVAIVSMNSGENRFNS